MSIWSEIRGKFVKPIVHESHNVALASELSDESENLVEDFEQAELDTISGLAILIDYQNSKGESSTRLITCKRLDQNAKNRYVYAFCHSREAIRQFRLDRILEVFDPQTGESLNPVDAYFERFAPDRIQDSPIGFGLSVTRRADLMALLNALVFIARCDREYHPLERSALENLLTRFWLRLEIAAELDEVSILQLADRLAPDAETFWVSLHRIANEPKLVRIMQETAKEVIEADGVLAKEEFYWGTKLDQFFSENA